MDLSKWKGNCPSNKYYGWRYLTCDICVCKKLLDLLVFCNISLRFIVKHMEHSEARNIISSMMITVGCFAATIRYEVANCCDVLKIGQTKREWDSKKGERVGRFKNVSLIIRCPFSGLSSSSLYPSITINSRFIARTHKEKEKENEKGNEYTLLHVHIFSRDHDCNRGVIFVSRIKS